MSDTANGANTESDSARQGGALAQEKIEVSEAQLSDLETELSSALDHLRRARDRGVPEEHAEEALNEAITRTLTSWGRIQTWCESEGEQHE